MIFSVKRLLKFAIFLIAVQVPAQTTQPRLVSHVDLRQLGLKVPAKGKEPELKIEILFLSNSRLLLLDWPGFSQFSPRNSRLSALEVSSGAVLRTMNPPFRGMDDFKRWGQLQRVSDGEFALTQSTGMMFCNAELECRQGPRVSGEFRLSRDGDRFIVCPHLLASGNETPWLLFDRESRQLGSYAENLQGQALVGNTGIFFASPSGLRFYPFGQSSAISLRPDASSESITLVGVDSVAYLRRGFESACRCNVYGLRALPTPSPCLTKDPVEC